MLSSILEQYPIRKIDRESKHYPQDLREITNPPETLYFRGNLPHPQQTLFAIVGTRNATIEGKNIAFSFAKELSNNNLVVVSGMARGIDTAAHQGAIDAQKPTFAVLGTGLAKKAIYPQENLGLAKKILEGGGGLISEYPPDFHGSAFTFPQRNRIIAGLSVAILVVEAKIKSGALNTANWARKQNKKVFAIPGNIYSANAQGTNFLIKRGASLTEKPNDILKELGLEKLTTSQDVTSSNPEEQLIISALKSAPLYIDAIIEKTNLLPQKVSALISIMELEGKIKNLGNNIYSLQ